MKLTTTAIAILSFVCVQLSAQDFSVSADQDVCAPTGGEVMLSATMNYDVSPDAIGWVVKLPRGWSLVATGGPNVPQLQPRVGATEQLEWAYVRVPDKTTQFSVMVRYPAGLRSSQTITVDAIIRAEGQSYRFAAGTLSLDAAKRPGFRAIE